jgi:uncharacterized protein with von Willebrand factor type A (vWA) domain
MADMKNPVQELAEVKTERDELKATVSALELRIKAMEEEKEKEEAEKTEEEKKKREEEEEAARKAKAEEDEKKKEDDAKAFANAIDAAVKAAIPAAVASAFSDPHVRAAFVAGSSDGVPEGGASGGKTLTMAEAVAEYNKIDPNDAKARAAYREAHKSELGL